MHTCPELLTELAHLLDEAATCAGDDVLVQVLHDDPDHVSLAVRWLTPGADPYDELHAAELDPACWALGLVVHGRAHLLDEPDAPPQPIVTTYLVGSDGSEVSLLRRAGRVELASGPIVGRLPDACRARVGAPAVG